MMGVSPADAARLTFWEYQGMLWHWNEAHKTGDEREAGRANLDPDKVRRDLAALAARNPAT